MLFEQQSPKNYPDLHIDRATVIKPCVAQEKASDLFLDKSVSRWNQLWTQLRFVVEFFRHIYLVIRGYLYPYSSYPLDEVCDIFSRCAKWSSSPIRAFAWHPNHDRCALAICNDYIYVYQGATRIRILRQVHQYKIVDLAWKPNDANVLAVATQTKIIIWSLTPDQSTQFNLIDPKLSPPIVKIQFNGSELFACSPNSYKIIAIDLNNLNGSPRIKSVGSIGRGVTQILWSPNGNRLASTTTSCSFRVFEPFSWSSKCWKIEGHLIQDMAWSRPNGRMLLLASRNEPCVYALPFLDQPEANDVGGNKSLMRVLNLQPTRSEMGTIGGFVQSLAWDKNGQRLAISFKDNTDSVLLYRTLERQTVEFQQLGIIKSKSNSSAQLIQFHDNFKDGSLLTVCWSDGSCQHITFNYSNHEYMSLYESRSGINSDVAKSPRSMTSFCHVSDAPMLPMGKCQNQNGLFSTRARKANPPTE